MALAHKGASLSTPYAAIGSVAAHGLAVILAVLLSRAAPSPSWHFTAMAVEILPGTSNIVFRQMFVAAEALAVGYLTTCLHWIFVVAQLHAAINPPSRADDSPEVGRRVARPAIT